MKSVERFGLTGILAIASAISSTPIEPEPSSSAPLLIESTRATGCARRMLSMFTRKVCSTSTVGCAMLFAIIQRTRWSLKALSESLSTGGAKPTWSLCAPIATYWLRSTGSLPGSTATTLRANSVGSSTKSRAALTVPPLVPVATPSKREREKSRAAASRVMRNVGCGCSVASC